MQTQEMQQIVPTVVAELSDYAPAATTLFNNMKLPAAVVTAGMISLGFATSFPELPRVRPNPNPASDTNNNNNSSSNTELYAPEIRQRCESLRRLHIVVSLVSVTSELIVVLWSAVEVNQLTEKQYAPSASVWDLIQRDCDLAWSAVNSHFVLGIIGFVTMLALRAYVMLLAAEASAALMTAASTGTAAALCLMISVVNRGVESGGGNGIDRYGNTILDLFRHYVVLLAEAATSGVSPGPLQLSAIVLEFVSLACMANVLLFRNGKTTTATRATATATAEEQDHHRDDHDANDDVCIGDDNDDDDDVYTNTDVDGVRRGTTITKRNNARPFSDETKLPILTTQTKPRTTTPGTTAKQSTVNGERGDGYQQEQQQQQQQQQDLDDSEEEIQRRRRDSDDTSVSTIA